MCIVLIDAYLLNGKNIESDNDDTNDICIGDIDEQFAEKNCCFGNPFSNSTGPSVDTAKSNDANKINSPVTKQQSMSPSYDTCALDKKVDSFFDTKKLKKNNYLGHFVVLIGYDDNKKLIFYRNPATSKKLSFTSYFNFEIARKSFGTDQDILFIYM